MLRRRGTLVVACRVYQQLQGQSPKHLQVGRKVSRKVLRNEKVEIGKETMNSSIGRAFSPFSAGRRCQERPCISVNYNLSKERESISAKKGSQIEIETSRGKRSCSMRLDTFESAAG